MLLVDDNDDGNQNLLISRCVPDFRRSRTIGVISVARDLSVDAMHNLVPACAKCNQSKNAKMPNAFIKNGQLVLI